MGESCLSELRFEFARKEHLPSIIEISNLTYREHATYNPEAFDTEFVNGPLEEWFRKSFENRNTAETIIVCLDGATVVGHVAFTIVDYPVGSPPMLEKTASISDISFSQNYRGRGLGQQAIQFLIPTLRKRGVTQVEAQIWAGNTASEKLFESMGFNNNYRHVSLRLGEVQAFMPQQTSRKWGTWKFNVFLLLVVLFFAFLRSQL